MFVIILISLRVSSFLKRRNPTTTNQRREHMLWILGSKLENPQWAVAPNACPMMPSLRLTITKCFNIYYTSLAIQRMTNSKPRCTASCVFLSLTWCFLQKSQTQNTTICVATAGWFCTILCMFIIHPLHDSCCEEHLLSNGEIEKDTKERSLSPRRCQNCWWSQ